MLEGKVMEGNTGKEIVREGNVGGRKLFGRKCWEGIFREDNFWERNVGEGLMM